MTDTGEAYWRRRRSWRRVAVPVGRHARLDGHHATATLAGRTPTALAPVSPPAGPAVVGPAAVGLGPAPVGPAPVGPAALAQSNPGAVPASERLLPGPRTPARRAKFAVANGCTVASLLLGLAAMLLAINGEYVWAALTLLGCVVVDGCDGALARRLGVASPFGAQMDSLTDLGSFGVATGIVMYQWLIAGGASPAAAAAVCAILAVCAAIRLARFNVSPKDGRYFIGVPTTMAAAVLALNIVIGPALPVNVELIAIAVYAVAMVTSFPHAKLIRVVQLPLWLWVVPAIVAMISVPAAFAGIAVAYLVSGPLVWLAHRRRLGLAGR